MKRLDEFVRLRSSKDGRGKYCLPCQRERATAYRNANREKIRAYDAAYREANREEVREHYRQWRKRNPGKDREHSNAWNARHPETVKAWVDKRRASFRGAFVARVYLDDLLLRDEGRCGICHQPIMGPMERDHILPLARGGTHELSNVQLAHPSCNRRKWASVNVEAA